MNTPGRFVIALLWGGIIIAMLADAGQRWGMTGYLVGAPIATLLLEVGYHALDKRTSLREKFAVAWRESYTRRAIDTLPF